MRVAYTNLLDSLAASAFTVLGTATGYPIENVQEQRLSVRYRTASASAQTIAIDLGTSKLVTTAAILGHNVSSGMTMDRGDCESATPPMVAGETAPLMSGATFARDATWAHGGTYSYRFTKTVAAGTVAIVDLTDNADITDMHGFAAGQVVTENIWLWIPSGSILGNEISIRILDYQGSWAQTIGAAAALYDQWQLVTCTRTLRSACTGALTQLVAASTAALNEYFYVDDISIDAPVPITVSANTSASFTAGNVITTLTRNVDAIVKFFTGVSYQYWQFTIDDPWNTDGYLEMGRLWLGEYLTISPSSLLDFTVTKRRSDMVAFGKNRQKYATPGENWRRFELSFPATGGSMLTAIQTMYDTVGNHSSLVFCNFDDLTTYPLVYPCYASIEGDIAFTHDSRQRYTYGLILEENK